MTTPAEVFPLLLGHWHLERTIPGHATMRGHVNITPDRDRIARYTEQVQIHTTTGAHLTGTARYLFLLREDGDLDVHLHTGILFHILHFTPAPHGCLEAHATHLCAEDTYTSLYRVLSPDHLAIEHQVTGPRKHYTAQTNLHRILA